jgi:hypothetical protein
MDLNFPHRDRKRFARPQDRRPIDYAALVASLVASQAVSTTARAEDVAGRPRHDDRSHAALLRIFAPRRSERRLGITVLAGSFHLATARALASTSEQPE